MGGKTTTSTNTVKIPQEVLDRYNAVNTQAAQVAQNPFQKYGENASDFVAQMNEQQGKGVAGINRVADMGASYNNVEKYLNPYIKNVADTTRAQMEQANEQAQSGALGTAVSSGAFGGDRAGVAAANLANQQGLAMGSTMANIYNQGYSQAQDASMADMNRMVGVAGQQLGAGTQMQQTEQAGKDALINQFQQEQGFPFQVAQFLANIAMGTGALTGSTTTAVNQGSFFSDRRLKHDIKEIGKSHDGMPIYTFKYKGDPEQHTHVGFMADEVEKTKPEAVGLDPSGYKTVDYDKATQSMGGGVHAHHKNEAFADGGVAGPYGSKVGQGVGVGSYIPEAYLPIGELMVADPTMAAQKTQGVADIMEAAANTGKSLTQLDETFGPDGKFWDIANSKKSVKAYGGGVAGDAVQPEKHEDYLSKTLASQSADKQKPELKTAAPGAPQESTFGQIVDLAGSAAAIASMFSDRRLKHDIKEIGKSHNGLPIYTFKYKGDDREQTHVGFMADEVEKKHPEAVGERNGMKTVDYSQAHKFASGGVAGDRHGYALDGAVMTPEQEMARRRLVATDVPTVQTLGSLPDATVQRANTTPAVPVTTAAPIRTQGLGGADAYREAATRRFEETPNAVPVSGPPPEGLAPAVAPTLIPKPRPEGLAAASEERRAGIEAAREHYRTKVVPTESGGRQFDPETGQPLTSSMGAVGAGQVLERTGPEAAALAGVEWDRDRWLNDQDYNLKIGEAYYLDQYRKFGSLDKADAAYNAGPTKVQNLIDEASRNGGSYFDLLPTETQEYLRKNGTMPDVTGGVTGGSRVTMSSRGEDQPAGGVKTYEDRNTLGKIVYDEDGKVNKNAMLSLFAGLGDMLSSPSPFLLPSIGAGISGAANTYMAREGQVANINAKNVENMGNLYNLYNKFLFTNPEYAGMTLEEFAERNGLTNMLPDGTENGTGVGSSALTMQDTRGFVDAGEGISIPFMNDYASLVRLYGDWQNAPEGTPQRTAADNAKVKIDQIRLNGYTTGIDESGKTVVVPVDSVRAEIGATVTDQNNIENTQAFRSEANKILPTIEPSINAIDRQAEIYSTFEANALASDLARAGALASALGINITGLNDNGQIAAVQEALKERARSIAARGGTGEATDFLTSFIDQGSVGPNLDPDAVKKLLVVEKASLMRERERLEGHDEWQSQARNPYDLNEFEAWFGKNYPLDGFIDDAEKDMPMFAGETGSQQRPHPVGTPNSAVEIGEYFTLPNGTIGADGVALPNGSIARRRD